MKWQFDDCQWEDGACGMMGRDDKWLGTTAGAVLSFLRVREAGFLGEAEQETYRQRAIQARDWMLAHLTPESADQGGYWEVRGTSRPKPRENCAWLLSWVLEALARLEEL
jgi:hypothetical protein